MDIHNVGDALAAMPACARRGFRGPAAGVAVGSTRERVAPEPMLRSMRYIVRKRSLPLRTIFLSFLTTFTE